MEQSDAEGQRLARINTRATVAIALFAGVTFLIGLLQLCVYKGQLRIARTEHTPLIGLTGIQPINGSTAVYLSFQNGGKAPAFKVRIGIKSETQGLTPPALYKGECADDDCRIRDFQMLPNVPLFFRVPRTNEPQIAPDAVHRMIIRLDYFDDSGNPHNAGICLLKSKDDLATCPEPDSNYTDKK